MNEVPQQPIVTFVCITDPGHGWLLVGKPDLAQVGLTEADITPYSYQKGDLVALEEDLDMDTFLTAWTKKFGKPELMEVYQDPTEVRNWAGYGTKARTW